MAGAYSYRVQLFWSGEEYAAVTLSTTTLAFIEVFMPIVAAGTNVAGIVNRKAVTMLYDQVVIINSNVATTPDMVQFPVNINFKNVKFPYQSAGGIYGKFKNLYFLVTPFVVGGTTGTTATGNVTFNYSLDYKDL